MIPNDDPEFSALARLPLMDSDDSWDADVRRRCHAVLEKQVWQRTRRDDARHGSILLAAASALCLYLGAVLMEAVRLITRFH